MHSSMQWPTEPTEAELQTFEYVLEYGGEGEGGAVVRTYLRGRPRYWQLVREADVDDYGDIIYTGKSRLEFLSHFTDAIFSEDKARHAWWKLEGQYLAPDLWDEAGGFLDGLAGDPARWINPNFEDDRHLFTCQVMWPDCEVTRRPVDAYWLTARPEVMRRVLGGLSRKQIQGLKTRPAKPVGVLVDRKGRVLMTEEPDYPRSKDWLRGSPFYTVKPFKVTCFSDIWDAVVGLEKIHPLAGSDTQTP